MTAVFEQHYRDIAATVRCNERGHQQRAFMGRGGRVVPCDACREWASLHQPRLCFGRGESR